jgi:hypothetical protein
MKQYISHIILIGLFLITLFFLNKCSQSKYTELEDKYKLTQVENQTFESLVNKKNDTIKTQNVIILKTEKSLKNYTDTIFNLKKKQERKIKEVIAYYNNKTDTRVDSFFVFEVDSIPYPVVITDDYVRDSMITVPRTYKVDSTYFKFDATVTKKGMLINSLSLPDTTYGRFVELKNGKIQYQVFNKNPYISIENSNSIIYQPKKKRLKWLIPLGVGIVTGILITK